MGFLPKGQNLLMQLSPCPLLSKDLIRTCFCFYMGFCAVQSWKAKQSCFFCAFPEFCWVHRTQSSRARERNPSSEYSPPLLRRHAETQENDCQTGSRA